MKSFTTILSDEEMREALVDYIFTRNRQPRNFPSVKTVEVEVVLSHDNHRVTVKTVEK